MGTMHMGDRGRMLYYDLVRVHGSQSLCKIPVVKADFPTALYNGVGSVAGGAERGAVILTENRQI